MNHEEKMEILIVVVPVIAIALLVFFFRTRRGRDEVVESAERILEGGGRLQKKHVDALNARGFDGMESNQMGLIVRRGRDRKYYDRHGHFSHSGRI